MHTLIDHAVGHLEVHAEVPNHRFPAIDVQGPFPLLQKIGEHPRTIGLDSLNVLEEAITLGLEHSRGQKGGGRSLFGNGSRWVEGVEHGHTVVLVEWLQGQFVDQNPTSQTHVDLRVQLVHLPLLLFGRLDPSQTAG